MRSILVLLAMAVLGFGFILQKKDPEPVKAINATQLAAGAGRTNLMKHAPETNRSIAQNISAVRKANEL